MKLNEEKSKYMLFSKLKKNFSTRLTINKKQFDEDFGFQKI